MDFLKQIAEALGLDDATEEQVLEAVKARPLVEVAKALGVAEDASAADVVKAAAELKAKAAEETSLADRAKAEGKVVVDAGDYAETKRNAERGRKAAEELHQSKFDRAFERALDEVRVDAKPETRERWQKLYDAADETTLEQLAALPKLAATEARGKTGKAGEAAPEGVDPDRFELDRKARAYIREHPDVDYVTALDRVIEAEEALV